MVSEWKANTRHQCDNHQWGYVTTNFARNIQIHPVIDDYTVLTQAGFLKGLGALFSGLICGFGFSTALTVLFLSLCNPCGIASGWIVLAAKLIGMQAKIYFMNHISSMVLTISIVSMVIKNFGIVFMGVGFITESLKRDMLVVW